MQHAEAVNALHEILPLIKTEGSAESAIIKFAEEKKLASAQVEKLAQVLNQARTLSFLDKNPDNRGADFPILDPAEIVKRYTENSGNSKCATLQPYADVFGGYKVVPSTDGTNQMRHVKTLPPRMAVPNFQKAAAESLKPEVKVDGKKVEQDPYYLECEAREFDRKKRDEVDEAVIESGEADIVMEQAKETSKKAYQELHERCLHLPFHEVEEDATMLGITADEKSVIAKLATDLNGYWGRENVQRFTVPDPKRHLAWDRHNIVDGIRKVAAANMLVKQAAEYATYVKKKASYSPPTVEPLYAQADEEEMRRDRYDNPATRAQRDKELKNKLQGNPANGAPRPNYNIFRDILQFPEPDKPKEKVHTTPGIDSAAAALKDILKEYPGISTQIQGAHGEQESKGLVSGLLQSEAPGKRQRSIDESYHSTRSLGTLQKLMMTDPILREADPDLIVDAFNDLMQTDPEIAKTPQMLAFQLREALQYGGIPASSAKTIADISKSREDASKNRRERTEALYKQ